MNQRGKKTLCNGVAVHFANQVFPGQSQFVTFIFGVRRSSGLGVKHWRRSTISLAVACRVISSCNDACSHCEVTWVKVRFPFWICLDLSLKLIRDFSAKLVSLVASFEALRGQSQASVRLSVLSRCR